MLIYMNETQNIRHSISDADYTRLLDCISTIVIERGFKTTTMDYVASTLSISKRTLYEIFEDKNHMMREALRHITERHSAMVKNAFESTSNVIEAMLQIFFHMRDVMKNVCIDFFRDMDSYAKETRCDYDKLCEQRRAEMLKLFQLGIEQGLFRDDINYDLQGRLLEVQLESIKRTENILPPGIGTNVAMEHISIGFLRSIASPKGSILIDECLAKQSHNQ